MDNRVPREANDDFAHAKDCPVSDVQSLAKDIVEKTGQNYLNCTLRVEN